MLNFLKYLRIPFAGEEPARDPSLPPPGLDKAGKLLWAAADLIEKRGLERVGFEGSKGELCIHGALSVAGGSVPGLLPETYGALWRMSKLLPDCQQSHRWIRDPSVTKEMVVAKMREAALL